MIKDATMLRANKCNWFRTLAAIVAAFALTTGIPAARADKPPDPVQVVNTTAQPVPTVAQGTTTVGGTVSVGNTVTVSGSVNIGNTPNVRISNTAGDPALVRDIDAKARTPVQAHVGQAPFTANSGATAAFTLFTVPPGKRLVIETVTLEVLLDIGHQADGGILTVLGNDLAQHELSMSPQWTTLQTRLIGTHPVKLYADPNTAVSIQVNRDTNSGLGLVFASMTGYLESTQ